MVTTTDSTAPSAERIGVALTSVVTLRPSGTEELDLLRAHRLGIAELVGEREFVEPDLAPVAPPADHDLQQLLKRCVRTAQPPGRSAAPRG